MSVLLSVAVTCYLRATLGDPAPFGPPNWRRAWLAARLETAFWLACVIVTLPVFLFVVAGLFY